jgi:hypothetical protein
MFLNDESKPQVSDLRIGLAIPAVRRGRVGLAVEQPVAGVPHAAEIELRLGYSQRERLQHRIGSVTGDAGRERTRLGCGLRISKDRDVQAVAQRVARRLGPACHRARPPAGPAVPAACRSLLFAAHETGAIGAAGASIT